LFEACQRMLVQTSLESKQRLQVAFTDLTMTFSSTSWQDEKKIRLLIINIILKEKKSAVNKKEII
jgi:hypothetical protein